MKEALKRVVFRSRRNDCSEVLALKDEGRVFHTRAAATGKARSPRVERRVDGTISVDVTAYRRRRRTSAALCSVSARYCGAVPLRQRYVRTPNRNWILPGTRNQCRSRRSGVVCSDYLAEYTSRSAAFSTDCNLCSSVTGRPANTELQ